MAQGETGQHCAGDGRPARPDPPYHGRPVRRACAEPAAPPPVAEESDAGPAEPVDAVPGRAPACRSERPGWAGAHRHLAVRPRRRANRRERPPDRWC